MSVDHHRASERERCPTCNQPIGAWKPVKICGACQKPIRKGHKWQIEGSMIRHRVCDEPDSYGSKYDPLHHHRHVK